MIRGITNTEARLSHLFIGTTNRTKAQKWNRILNGTVELIYPSDIGLSLAISETGQSTTENAKIKAVAWSATTGLPTLADDLGLFINALGGFPGHTIKTWGTQLAESASEAERMTFLRDSVHQIDDTTCILETAIVLALPSGQTAQLVHQDRGWIDKTRAQAQHTHGALLEWVFIFDKYKMSWREMTERQRALIDQELRIKVVSTLSKTHELCDAPSQRCTKVHAPEPPD